MDKKDKKMKPRKTTSVLQCMYCERQTEDKEKIKIRAILDPTVDTNTLDPNKMSEEDWDILFVCKECYAQWDNDRIEFSAK